MIAYAVEHKLPVLFTLNGGIWADAVCDVPEWDVNDHLEQDKANCQWNEHDQVMADDYLKHLPRAGKPSATGPSSRARTNPERFSCGVRLVAYPS